MGWRRFVPFRASARVAAVFFLAALSVGLIVALMIRTVLPEHPRNQLSEQLAAALAADLTADEDAVTRLAQRLGFPLAVVEDGQVVSSPQSTASLAEIEAALLAHPGERSFETRLGLAPHFFLRDGKRVVVMGHYTSDLSPKARWLLAGGLAAILLVLALAFVMLLRIVRPLTPLSVAVRRIGQGHFEERITLPVSGEIGALAERVNEMAATLQRTERAKRELLVAVGHEFSSPIARIMFQVERIGDTELKTRITSNLMRMNLLFRTLVSVQMMEETAWKSEAMSFPDAIVEICEELGEGQLLFTVPGKARTVYCDRMRLELLLSNFISNALRHAPGSPIEVSASHGDDQLTIVVSDRGPGVPPALLDRLMEPFGRTDSARRPETGGFGLGLYLCNRIAQRAGGRLTLANRQGGGLDVRLCLPCTGHRTT